MAALPRLRPTSLEEACCRAILQFSRTAHGVLRQRLPRRVRVGLVRRIVLEGRVTSLMPVLATWPEKTLTLGDICCNEPSLFYHSAGLDVDELVPQLLKHAMSGGRSSAEALSRSAHQALPVVFLCARFIEVVLKHADLPLRHFDLTTYGFVPVTDFVLVMDALTALYERDMRSGYQPEAGSHFTLTVSLAYNATREWRRPIQDAVLKLTQLLELQRLRRTRVRLRVTGVLAEVNTQQERHMLEFLRKLADHHCCLRMLMVMGPSDLSRPEHAALLSRFPKVAVLQVGTRPWMRPGGRNLPRSESRLAARLPGSLSARSLILDGCTRRMARQLVRQCRSAADAAGTFRSMSLTSDLLSEVATADLTRLHRLSVDRYASSEGDRARRWNFNLARLCATLFECHKLEALHLHERLQAEHVEALAAALPSLVELRFLHLGLWAEEPVAPLVRLCEAARRLPLLRAAHVTVNQQPSPYASDQLMPYLRADAVAEVLHAEMLVERLQRLLSPPQGDDVLLYVSVKGEARAMAL